MIHLINNNIYQVYILKGFAVDSIKMKQIFYPNLESKCVIKIEKIFFVAVSSMDLSQKALTSVFYGYTTPFYRVSILKSFLSTIKKVE